MHPYIVLAWMIDEMLSTHFTFAKRKGWVLIAFCFCFSLRFFLEWVLDVLLITFQYAIIFLFS
jgi:hypothetical protein